MKMLKTKLGSLLAILALTLSLTVASSPPAAAATNCGYSLGVYTPFQAYGGVLGGAYCTTGPGPVVHHYTCVEYWSGSAWENADWTCATGFWDSSPKFCGLYYRTRAFYTYIGAWSEQNSNGVFLC